MNSNIKVASDNFKQYFAEKIWSLIPAIYKHEDGLNSNPSKGSLRAFVEVLANQAAILRRSQDHLWNDQFIALCNEWAVPYIADLLGTRLISSLNKRGRRADVANTIYYRRRKGTPAILEQVISDITGWEGVVKEQFKRLSRNYHGLDINPFHKKGPVTGTLPGGTANLRSIRSRKLANSPFDEFYHYPDVRKPQGALGWYGIHKITFHLYRLIAYEVEGSTPYDAGGSESKRRFSFDPSGRNIQLFMPRNRNHRNETQFDWSKWQSAKEWELPSPICCLLLNNSEFKLSEENIHELSLGGGPILESLRSIIEIEFKSLKSFKERIESLPGGIDLVNNQGLWDSLLKGCIIQNCGKNQLIPNAMAIRSPDEIPKEDIIAGKITNEPLADPNYSVILDPEKGEFILRREPDDIAVNYHYGLAGPVGAGTYSRADIATADSTNKITGTSISSADLDHNGIANHIGDNRTYQLNADKIAIRELIFQSENQMRPYVKIVDKDWRLKSHVDGNARIILNGIWFGCDEQLRCLRIQGNFEQVLIKNCTLDPGGDKTIDNVDINPVCIVVEGFVEHFIIENSITGPVYTEISDSGDQPSAAHIDCLEIKDSIIQTTDNSTLAINLDKGETNITRSTIIGKVSLQRLNASTSIFTGIITVNDTQNSCFRFSAAPKGYGSEKSRLPKPYPYDAIQDPQFQNWIKSIRFGDSTYAQLNENGPENLTRGSESGSELGAFNKLNNPIKLDGLKAKVSEYMPFGLLPHFIYES